MSDWSCHLKWMGRKRVMLRGMESAHPGCSSMVLADLAVEWHSLTYTAHPVTGMENK